jgi:hypothetical protein
MYVTFLVEVRKSFCNVCVIRLGVLLHDTLSLQVLSKSDLHNYFLQVQTKVTVLHQSENSEEFRHHQNVLWTCHYSGTIFVKLYIIDILIYLSVSLNVFILIIVLLEPNVLGIFSLLNLSE